MIEQTNQLSISHWGVFDVPENDQDLAWRAEVAKALLQPEADKINAIRIDDVFVGVRGLVNAVNGALSVLNIGRLQ